MCIFMLNAVSKEMVSKTQKWAKPQKSILFPILMKLKTNRQITTNIPLTTLKSFFFRIGVEDKSLSLYPFLGLNLGSVTPMKNIF